MLVLTTFFLVALAMQVDALVAPQVGALVALAMQVMGITSQMP